MTLQEQLIKLYIPCKEPLNVMYRRHPSQLKVVGKVRVNLSNQASSEITDWLVYRNYID